MTGASPPVPDRATSTLTEPGAVLGRPTAEGGARPGPPIGGHRLLGNGRSLALVTSTGEIDWWCAPELDSPPLLWSLLDHRGAAARWLGARYASTQGRPAGPGARGVVVIDGTRVAYRDGLLDVDGTTCLVRLVRLMGGGGVALCHQLAIGGFDGPRGIPDGVGFRHDGSTIGVFTDGESAVEGEWLRSTVVACADRWSGLIVTVGPAALELDDAVARLDEDERAAVRRVGRARLPRHHPERAADALAVLEACTYQATGAVVAAATTSLPEAPGADRQFDYRYCWLRDAALATSVASLLGQHDLARHHLDFLVSTAGPDPRLRIPVVDVRGDPVPEERTVEGIEGWASSRPVRVGNGAAGQLQYDAWGLVVEAVSVHLQTGGSLAGPTWKMVCALADRIASDEPEPSGGIWELRDPSLLLSGDIGRWLVLDRAIWIARGWRPSTRRRHWKRARSETRERVLSAIDDNGRVPQSYDGDDRPDASALMIPLFGMLGRRDPRALRLVRAILDDLGAGPFLYRYPPGGDDGFRGTEGAFLPVGWWAVAALAVAGQVDEAEARADQLCAALPPLLSEEVDPVDGTALGNVPLVWSHMELARALYLLDAARLRRRYGTAGLAVWRVARFASLRRRRQPSQEHNRAALRRHRTGGPHGRE